MMRFAPILLLGLAAIAAPGTAPAQQTTEVRFAAGTSGASLDGRITGRDYRLYTLGAEAGQRMSVRLTSDNDAAYFNLYAPGKGPGDEALAIGETTPEVNAYDGELPQSGVYTVSVYLYRNARPATAKPLITRWTSPSRARPAPRSRATLPTA